MRYCFDIDNTICFTTDTDYDKAKPDWQMIKEVNKLYDKGHIVLLQTARGSLSGVDHRTLTETQLEEWGVKYHELHFGKVAADLYVDDKGMGKWSWLDWMKGK